MAVGFPPEDLAEPAITRADSAGTPGTYPAMWLWLHAPALQTILTMAESRPALELGWRERLGTRERKGGSHAQSGSFATLSMCAHLACSASQQ